MGNAKVETLNSGIGTGSISEGLQEYVQMVALVCTLHVLCTVKDFAPLHEVHFPADDWKTERDIGVKIENTYIHAGHMS